MHNLPSTLWGCTESVDMLGYVEMKSLTSSQGVAPLRSLYALSRPLGSPGRISIGLNAAWITNIWQCGVVLVVLKDRLEK
jgi:hypothetical protein